MTHPSLSNRPVSVNARHKALSWQRRNKIGGRAWLGWWRSHRR